MNEEVNFKKEVSVSGLIYDEDGKKSAMTESRLKDITEDIN